MTTWNIDTTHANVDFSVKHMAISTVRGAFNLFNGTGATNEDGFPVSLAMQIDAASISTNNEQRDGHLKSPDFFDVANHPTLTFKSTRISGTREDVTIVGDLTIRGVTKSVTLKGELGPIVKDPWGNEYKYTSPGAKMPYDIVSYGADGKEGGDGPNKDITSN